MRRLVTVLGNLSVDHVDDEPPSPGGCPSFAGIALAELGERARIVTRAASDDLPLFRAALDAIPVPCRLLEAATTSSFELRYSGDQRVMQVAAIGPVWTPDDIAAAEPDSDWVHVAPLLRSDFPAESLTALAADGRRVSFDGQGLTRRPELGPMRLDAEFDRALLTSVTVLKLADDEAEVVAGGAFGSVAARSLGVPEILVTSGSGGCVLYADDTVAHVPAAWRVAGAQSTGAGDMFVTSYVSARAQGRHPTDAAEQASRFVAGQLQARLDAAKAHRARSGARRAADFAQWPISRRLRAARQTRLRLRRGPRPR